MVKPAPSSCRIDLSVRFSNGTECRLDRLLDDTRWCVDLPLYELMLPLIGELSFVVQYDGHGSYLMNEHAVDDVWRVIDTFEAMLESGEAVVDTAENRLVLSREGDAAVVRNFWQVEASDHTESKTFEIPWAELRAQVERIVATRAELVRCLDGHVRRTGVELWSEPLDGLVVSLAVDDLRPAAEAANRVVVRIQNGSRAVIELVNHFEHRIDRGEGEATLWISSCPEEGISHPPIPLAPGQTYEVRLDNVKLGSAVILRATFGAWNDLSMTTSMRVEDRYPDAPDLSGCWQGQIEAPPVALVPRHRNWRSLIGSDDLDTWLADATVRASIAARREARSAAAVGTAHSRGRETIVQAGIRAAIAHTDWATSVEEAIRCVQDRNDAVGLAAKGSVLLALGEYQAAERAYLEAACIASTPEIVRDLLRALTPEGGPLEGAAERCVELFEKQSAGVATWTTLGRLLLDLRYAAAAVDCLEAAYELDSDDSTICLELGRALKKNDEPERAREVLAWGLQLEESPDLLEEMARLCYFRLDDYDAAIEHYSRLFEVAPKQAGGQRRHLASCYRLVGRHAEAIAAAEEAVRDNPRSPAEHKTLGDILFAAERTEDALAAYGRANEAHLEFGRSFPAALYGRAECLEKLGKPDDAIAALQEILDIDPDHARAHNKLGTIYERRGDLDRASEYYNRALEIDSESADSAYPRCNLGTVALKRGRFDESVEWLTRALEHEPKLYIAHNNLGCVLLEVGREAEAIVALERAIEVEPHNPMAYFNIACVYGRGGRTREAFAWLERAVDEGYSNRDKLLSETDLDSIRDTVEFQRLLGRVSA